MLLKLSQSSHHQLLRGQEIEVATLTCSFRGFQEDVILHCIINHFVTCFFNNIFYPIFIYYQTFLQLLKMILSFLVSKSRITEGFRRDSLAKYEQVRS